MKIELYIDKQLCNIGDPEKFSVYLKRELYNPTELNTKDAQVSYTITLPATDTNNTIFGFANVEEVKGKFVRLYDAELIVNGIKIFEGKFRLNEIDPNSYKGNLGIPAPKTVREIFKDKKMNEIGEEWLLDIATDIPDYKNGLSFISYYNEKKDSPCMFPFVMYGLLPKKKGDNGDYSAKNIIDKTVRIGVEDIPPSLRCKDMLEKIFASQGYNLSGSAFADERLANLYVSYRNPNEYVQEWNWGDLGTITVEGKWKTGDTNKKIMEKHITRSRDDYGSYQTVNLFQSNFLDITKIEDSGTNVVYNIHTDNTDVNLKKHSLDIIIPKSGYYKVELECKNFQLADKLSESWGHSDNGYIFTGVRQDDNPNRNNDFIRKRFELQLMRDYGEGDFQNLNLVGYYNKPQFPQEPYVGSGDRQYPKYYPYDTGALVVDPGVNENFICGFRWGQNEYDRNAAPGTSQRCNYMFIANGFSWDKTFSQKKRILSAYDSSSYLYNDENNKYVKTINNYHCWGARDDQPEDSSEEGTGEVITEEKDIDAIPAWLEDNAEQPIYTRYGRFVETPEIVTKKTDLKNYVSQMGNVKGAGRVECIVWLEKGERLALCWTADLGDRKRSGHKTVWNDYYVIVDELDFSLHIEPYRTDIEWNNFDAQGNHNPAHLLSWGTVDDVTFQRGKIDLSKFLPSEVKIDEWIENFCKAFNLSLMNVGNQEFRLDIKQKEIAKDASLLIDIDSRAHIVHRSNTTLGLPYVYELGFTVNSEEEGFYNHEKTREKGERNFSDDDENINKEYAGGGEFYTGSHTTDVVSQKSSFSYCWYRKLYDTDKKKWIRVPVITDHQVWDNAGQADYDEMMKKTYFDKAQRFWYRKGETHRVSMSDSASCDLALVNGEYNGSNKMILDYENKPDSILDNYFYLLNNSKDFTEVECFLTPEEYAYIDKSMVKFNGDLYNIISIDGYDPGGRKKATLKLLRKII